MQNAKDIFMSLQRLPFRSVSSAEQPSVTVRRNISHDDLDDLSLHVNTPGISDMSVSPKTDDIQALFTMQQLRANIITPRIVLDRNYYSVVANSMLLVRTS